MLFDLHIHSKYSRLDSASEIEDIIRIAKERGLGAIAISDHDTIEGSLKAAKLSSKELIIIPSIEICSRDGHVIGLGLTKQVEWGLTTKETVDRVHDLGGLAIAAHPYDHLRSGVGDLCWMVDFDAIEINSHCLYGNSEAKKAAKKHKKPMVGGSDAHSVNEVGAICTEVNGNTVGEILENIKQGKCKPVYMKNFMSLKAATIANKISRKVNKVF